jgi:hypothetical protein
MSVDMYVKKSKINNSDYNNIAKMPYMDQIEIFKTRSLNKYKLLNPQRYPTNNKTEFQQAYETRRKKQNMDELKRIQEAENKLENKMKLRSSKNLN